MALERAGAPSLLSLSLAMQLTPLLLATLVPAAAAQSSIVREVTAEVTATDEDFAQGAYTRDLNAFGATLPIAPGLFDQPALDGVRPVATKFDFESSVLFRASLTNSQAVPVEDGLLVGEVLAMAAGLGDTYGPLALISAASANTNYTRAFLQPGETQIVEMNPLGNVVPSLLSIRYTPSSPLWCMLETECPETRPPFVAEILAVNLGPWTGECDLNWSEGSIVQTSRFTAELELDEVTAGIRPFCEPNANVTPVALRAFGSTQAGTDWLSMRVDGVSAGAPIAVIGASQVTAVAATPMGICIGGSRLAQSVAIADSTGGATLEVSLASFQPGDRVAFQALYRTPMGFDVSTGQQIELQ